MKKDFENKSCLTPARWHRRPTIAPELQFSPEKMKVDDNCFIKN